MSVVPHPPIRGLTHNTPSGDRARPAVRAAIVGAGLCTPLGQTAAESWQRLLAGHAITDHARAAGGWDRSTPRVTQMARRVTDEAIREAGWGVDDLGQVPLVLGTSKGSIEHWITPPLSGQSDNAPIAAGGQTPPPSAPDPEGLADVAAHLARRFGTGPRLTVSAACASGLVALARAAMLIESGQAKRVIVVAAEASVHPLFLGSFKRLGVLPPPGVGCRPFDRGRQGFLMSEAAAAVCLEAIPADQCDGRASDHPAAYRPRRRPAVVIDRYALGADASHLTASDPDGRVLRYLINKVLDRQGADIIHAHGTGTPANDPVELLAIESALAQLPAPSTPPPCLYSHKAALGHSLGAAGLVGVVVSRMIHQSGQMPGNVRSADPLPMTRASLSPQTQRRNVRRSLCIAAGFGGATAVVGLSSLPLPPDGHRP